LPIFNLQYPVSIPGVNSKILNPKDSWSDASEYDETLQKVAAMFKNNFHKFEKDASDQVKSGGPY
jgi:phosphoenolpyruvate carboxykinase (ATP)